MKLLGFSALTMHSKDPQRLTEFYRALGIPLVADHHGKVGEHFECELGDVHLAVLKAPGQGASPMVPVFQVDDLGAARTRLESLGVKPHHKPIDLGSGMQVVTFADPDGNSFRLIEIPAPG